MNEPRKPEDHPDTPRPAKPPNGNGVPPGAAEEDAKGAPNSDRKDTETAGTA